MVTTLALTGQIRRSLTFVDLLSHYESIFLQKALGNEAPGLPEIPVRVPTMQEKESQGSSPARHAGLKQ